MPQVERFLSDLGAWFADLWSEMGQLRPVGALALLCYLIRVAVDWFAVRSEGRRTRLLIREGAVRAGLERRAILQAIRSSAPATGRLPAVPEPDHRWPTRLVLASAAAYTLLLLGFNGFAEPAAEAVDQPTGADTTDPDASGLTLPVANTSTSLPDGLAMLLEVAQEHADGNAARQSATERLIVVGIPGAVSGLQEGTRFGLVSHNIDIETGDRSTTLFCVEWIVDVETRDVMETSGGLSTRLEEFLFDGWLDHNERLPSDDRTVAQMLRTHPSCLMPPK